MTEQEVANQLNDLVNRAVEAGVDTGEMISEMEGIIDGLKADD